MWAYRHVGIFGCVGAKRVQKIVFGTKHVANVKESVLRLSYRELPSCSLKESMLKFSEMLKAIFCKSTFTCSAYLGIAWLHQRPLL